MQIAFLGFGLIGGSIARAVRANPETKDWTMSAWSPSGDGPRKAAADLVIDVAGAESGRDPARCRPDRPRRTRDLMPCR